MGVDQTGYRLAKMLDAANTPLPAQKPPEDLPKVPPFIVEETPPPVGAETQMTLPDLNNKAQWSLIEQTAKAGNAKSKKLLEMRRIRLAEIELTKPKASEIPLTSDQRVNNAHRKGFVGDF